MAGRATPRQGKKLSVYFSGAQLDALDELDLTPAEIVRRGFLWQDAPAVPPDLQPSLGIITRVATALLNGGTITYPDRPGDPG